MYGWGEYPGYYCYDKDRPTWMPYWLNSPTEDLCAINPKTIAGNIWAYATGSPEYGKPTAAIADPAKSGQGVAQPGEETNVPICDSFQSFNPQTGLCETNALNPGSLYNLAQKVTGTGNEPKDDSIPWYLWLAGGLGVGVVLLSVSSGGPRRYGR